MHLVSESRALTKRRLGLSLLVLSMAVVFAACGGSTATSAPAATDAPAATEAPAASDAPATTTAKIGFAQAHLGDPFQQVLLDQLVAQTAEQGGQWVGSANANDDPAKQVTDMSSLATKGANALIVGPVDAGAIVAAIDAASAAGIPVVSIDSAPAGGKPTMVVRANNLKMGESACMKIGELLGGAGTVLELQGALVSTNGLHRSTGFGDCMKANFPNIVIEQVPADWQVDKAATGAQTILSTKDINGIYWATDGYLPGIQKVLQDLDKWKKVGEPGHVAIVGIDGTAEALQAIKEGYQDATLSQPLDQYAKYSVMYAIGGVNGETWADGPTDHGSTIVTENGIQADELVAPLVTAENADDPNLWANMVAN